MCGCGIDTPCSGCDCGCDHTIESFAAWQIGYRVGRSHAAKAINQMPDIDAGVMEEIEKDPDLDDTYILVRRTDAALVARGDGFDV